MQGGVLPENVNVEGYEDLEIRLPESCKGTTSVQLAVALSHLKVTIVTVYIICKRCNICAITTASPECSLQGLCGSIIRCPTQATVVSMSSAHLWIACMLCVQAVLQAYISGAGMALITEDDMKVLRWPSVMLTRMAPLDWDALLLYMMGPDADDIYR